MSGVYLTASNTYPDPILIGGFGPDEPPTIIYEVIENSELDKYLLALADELRNGGEPAKFESSEPYCGLMIKTTGEIVSLKSRVRKENSISYTFITTDVK